jgi:CHAD domain-containing protein
MAYRFKVDEPISKGASRIALEQIDIAVSRLARRSDIPGAIHDTRRSLKRLRALLRLLRPALTKATYRREAKRLAGTGRLLARARDHYVMNQTLAKLQDRFKELPQSIGAKLNKLLANGARPATSRTTAESRRQAVQALEQAQTFFTSLERRTLAFHDLVAGLERSYRRARSAFHDAYDKPSDEAFHEWRKRVQQHWRHMQLLSRGWPDVMSGRADEAKEVSRLLGEDHDLHVLVEFAKGRGKKAITPEELATLVTMCRSLQAELRELARPRGARLFAESAGDLTERIKCYWLAARELGGVSQSSEDEQKAPAKPKTAPSRGRKSRRAERPAA